MNACMLTYDMEAKWKDVHTPCISLIRKMWTTRIILHSLRIRVITPWLCCRNKNDMGVFNIIYYPRHVHVWSTFFLYVMHNLFALKRWHKDSITADVHWSWILCQTVTRSQPWNADVHWQFQGKNLNVEYCSHLTGQH